MTLSCAMDFSHEGLNDLPLIGGLCLVQRTLTTKGLNDLPLIGGLCLVQRTLTARGLNDLPLIGGLCLVQQTLTTKGVGTLSQGYVCNVPLPRVPQRQNTTRSQVYTIPDYYKVPYAVPTYTTPCSIVEIAAYAFPQAWHAIAINT
jgi:hypothetical protein